MDPARATSLEPQWLEQGTICCEGGQITPFSGREERTRSLGRDTRRRAMSQARGSTRWLFFSAPFFHWEYIFLSFTQTSGTGGLKTETLPANLRQRAVVNQRVDPFTDFPSLRCSGCLPGLFNPVLLSTNDRNWTWLIPHIIFGTVFWLMCVTKQNKKLNTA